MAFLTFAAFAVLGSFIFGMLSGGALYGVGFATILACTFAALHWLARYTADLVKGR